MSFLWKALGLKISFRSYRRTFLSPPALLRLCCRTRVYELSVSLFIAFIILFTAQTEKLLPGSWGNCESSDQ